MKELIAIIAAAILAFWIFFIPKGESTTAIEEPAKIIVDDIEIKKIEPEVEPLPEPIAEVIPKVTPEVTPEVVRKVTPKSTPKVAAVKKPVEVKKRSYSSPSRSSNSTPRCRT